MISYESYLTYMDPVHSNDHLLPGKLRRLLFYRVVVLFSDSCTKSYATLQPRCKSESDSDSDSAKVEPFT